MKKSWPNNLTKTRKALKRYFSPRRVSIRQARMDAALDNASVEAWLASEEEELREVRTAFFEDTKEVNSLENCLLLDVFTLKEWCDKAEAAMKKTS